MIRRLYRSVRTRQDEGEALIFALLVVAVIAIVVAAALQFSGSGLLTTPQLRDVRNSLYYSQGALDGAINSIRGSSEAGTGGNGSTNCPLTPSSATILTTPGPADTDGNDSGAYGSGHQYTVNCMATDTSGGNQTDQPPFAILTLGQSATGDCTAGHIQASLCTTGNHLLTVDGGVFATGALAVDSTGGNDKTALGVNGSVYATGACSGRLSTIDLAGPHCNFSDTAHIGADPGYPAAVNSASDLTSLIGTDTPAASLLGADPVPTCTVNPSQVTEFWPGYYGESPPTLVAMQNADSASLGVQKCTGTVWWFHPGSYYFDYQGTWTIGSPGAVTVIAGTSTGTWSIPGGCVNFEQPNGHPVADGVQFEFGGSSQVKVGSQGGIELCGPTTSQAAAFSSPTKQHIVVYGLDSHNSVSSPTSSLQTLAASAPPTSTGTTAFLNPSQAETHDGLSAVATLPKNSSAELSYSSFAHLPKGSRLTPPPASHVDLRVWSTLTGGSTSGKIIVTTPSHSSQSFSVGSVCVPCTIHIDSSLIAPLWRDVNALTLKYDVTTGNSNGGGTATVDAVDIQATGASPVLEALSCTTSSCPYFWDSSVNLNTFMHGTSYAPSVGWSVEINNTSGTIFDRGVVLRNLFVNVVASSTQTMSPFELPRGTPFGRQVELTAYLDGTPKVRACVFYTDSTPSGQAFPGYQVVVKRWQVLPPNAGASPACTG